MADRTDLRQHVIALIENGFSASEAGRRCHVPLRTAQRWAHKFQNYGVSQRCYFTGCPCCLTREEDEAVRWVDEENSFCSANQIRAAANFPGSFWTVTNRLRDANIHCWRAASKEGLTGGQAVDRLAFATGCRDFDRENIIFTDKTSISSDCESRGHVYREPGTIYDTRYIQRRERSGRFSLSCWGWMSHTGVGILECIHSQFNALQYLHIFENMMLLSVRVRIPEGNLIFQQDNQPLHCSMGDQRWFARRPEIELIPWPRKSPYLNIVEHMWAKLKEGRILRYGNNPPRNPQQLWDQVVEIWNDLAQDYDYCLTLFRLYAPKMPVGHRCWWHVDKVLDPHIIFCLL